MSAPVFLAETGTDGVAPGDRYVLDGAEGRFDVPDGLDLAEFPVVDVSEEHFDGDPSHSGDSVVRGPLDV